MNRSECINNRGSKFKCIFCEKMRMLFAAKGFSKTGLEIDCFNKKIIICKN